MRILRALAAVCLVSLVTQGLGCSGHAVAESDCRTIERARCTAARACSLGIDSESDVAACDRYARDNCLHGLPIGSAPSPGKVDACVRAIDAAGACAKAKAGPDSLATSCDGITAGVTTVGATVCDVIQNPEEAVDCGFLLAEPKPAVTVDSGAPPPEPEPGTDSGAVDGS